MGAESLSEIARQINPQLWDKPERSGSDPIQTRTTYRGYLIDGLDDYFQLIGAKITRVGQKEPYAYVSKPENTPYEKDAIYKVRGVAFNENRGTATIIYEDVDEQIQFATWRVDPSINKIGIMFVPIQGINSVDPRPH